MESAAAELSNAVPLSHAVGIDIGSNVARLALLDVGAKMPKILRNELSNESTPTAIALVPGLSRVYGDNATSKEVSKPQCTVSDLAEWVLRDPSATRSVGDVETLDARAAMSYFLKNLFSFVPKEQFATSKICISVPPATTAEGLEAVKSAAVIAGATPDRVVLVDTSDAALVYLHHLQRASLPAGADGAEAVPIGVVVIDIGKRNTSASAGLFTADKVVKLAAQTLPMGSADLDARIADHVLKAVELKHKGVNMKAHAKSYAKIMRECRKAKEMLSSVDTARVQAESLKDDIDINVPVTRKELDELAAPWVEQLKSMLKGLEAEHGAALRANGTGEIRVECIGAGWRSVCVADAIKQVFGAHRIGVSLDSNMAVAEGCCIFGACSDAAMGSTATINGAVVPPSSEDGGAAPPKVDGRDAIHNVLLENFASASRNVSTKPQDVLDTISNAEKILENADAVIENRVRAINALDSFILQTLDASHQCTSDTARQEAIRAALAADEEYVRDECNDDTIDLIEARLVQVTARVAEQFPEIAAYYETLREDQRKKDEELKRLSDLQQQEEKELKSDPQRLRAAQQRREQGQTLFKQEHWAEAQTRFVQALSILGELYDIKDEETKKKKDEISLSCHLNISSCSIKLQMWRNALNNASSALDLSPKNPKALFRRGQAASMMNEYAAARADLELAKELTNGDAAIVQELEAVIKKEEGEKAKEKKMFARMFS